MIKKIFIGGLVLICILGGIFWHHKVTYVGELVDPLTYFDEFIHHQSNLVYEDKRVALDDPIIIKEGQLFVKYEFAHDYVTDIIFYDKAEKVMTLTNHRQVLKLTEGENEITYGDVSGTYTLWTEGEDLYISSNLLTDLFGVTVEQGEDGRLFVATDRSKEQRVAQVKKKTSLRTHPQKYANVVQELKRGSTVHLYEVEDGFIRVRSEDGIIGYVKVSDIKTEEVQEPLTLPTVAAWPEDPLGEKVRLVWDQITRKVETNWSATRYSQVTKANVISPTWFELGDSEGNLVDRGMASYVTAAHERGLEVWPILSHSFENPGLTEQVFSSTTKRQRVINQIIRYAKAYGFDGINIDIENVQTHTSAGWVQFMRELYPQLKQAGLTVSVDVYMPSNWSSHYERETVAKSCDYFVVMAYDQHWSGSESPGSVAELPWVEHGIQETLKEVPKEKLVLGMPFYARCWTENSKGLTTKSYDMVTIKKMIADWGVSPVLDEKSGQHYVAYEKDNNLYQIWIEDELSIAKRVALINTYDLAGFGAWKLGLETKDVWQILEQVQ